MRIIMRHMAPNVMAPFLIMVTAFVGQAILAEASLSYLGLGVQEPVPAWGLMLQGGAEEYASTAPWIAIFPGVAIFLTVFAYNLIGEAFRERQEDGYRLPRSELRLAIKSSKAQSPRVPAVGG